MMAAVIASIMAELAAKEFLDFLRELVRLALTTRKSALICSCAQSLGKLALASAKSEKTDKNAKKS